MTVSPPFTGYDYLGTYDSATGTYVPGSSVSGDTTTITYDGVSVPVGGTIIWNDADFDDIATYQGYYLHNGVQHPLILVNGDYVLLGDAQGLASYPIITAPYSPGTACYLRGTAILTARGEVPVESLQQGDFVVTFSGFGSKLKAVRWVGHRRLDLRRYPDPTNTHPIRFRAGALGEGLPHRDLLVSPNHHMRVDDTLVTAQELVNGATIVQESPDEAEYWHVELDCHDLLLAEGVQAESYQDTGDRSAFENHDVVELNPVLDGDGATEPCLPYASASSAVRARLIARAEALGWTRTIEPAPWLEADGRRIEPVRTGETCQFTLPAGCSQVTLHSSTSRPSDVDPHSGDRRRLGLKLHHLALGTRRGLLPVALHSPALAEGFNRVEYDETGHVWRWTTGAALLPLNGWAPGQWVEVLEIAYDQTLPMWVAPAASRVAETAEAEKLEQMA